MTTIVLICPAERKTLGQLELESGEKITAATLRDNFESAVGIETKSAMLALASHGSPLLCPTCRNQVIAGLPGQDMQAAVDEDLRVLLGSTRVR